jgi:REP element-mobilizing transposase RayT
MARPLRIEQAGSWYHVTARGNERRAIYRDERDRGHFCELLAETVGRFQWALHAYVLMDNHFHLLVETREPNLGAAMQWLNVSYSVWFNRRHRRVGHLFQGRYQAVIVEPASWGLALSRYVHLNPVRVGRLHLDKAARQRARAGIVEKPDPAVVRERLAVLRRYRWSSYPAYVGLVRAPAWLQTGPVLALGGKPQGQTRQQAYREYVASAVREGLPESPWERLQGRAVLGEAAFLRRLREGLSGDPREQPQLRRLQARPTLEEVIARVERLKEEKWAVFRDRYGDWGRDLVLYLGRKDCGLKLRELGEAVGGLDYVSVGAAVKRFEQRLTREESLASQLRQVRQPIQM